LERRGGRGEAGCALRGKGKEALDSVKSPFGCEG